MSSLGNQTTRQAAHRTGWQIPIEDALAEAPFGIGLLNCADYRWIYINNSFIHMTGRRGAADFVGKTMRESLPETEKLGFFELLEKACAKGEICRVLEMRLSFNRPAAVQPRDGYFDFGFQPLRDQNGPTGLALIHALEVTANVTARRAQEDRVRRIRLTQSAAQIGTWEWDPLKSTVALSSQLHNMFGTSRTDPESTKRWTERVFPDDWPMVNRLMMEGHRHRKIEFEYRYLHPEKGLRWFYCKGRRARGQTLMYGIVQD
ncbi:MAG: PAS domain-containing protein, partial [Terracidiphilus sp.]